MTIRELYQAVDFFSFFKLPNGIPLNLALEALLVVGEFIYDPYGFNTISTIQNILESLNLSRKKNTTYKCCT